MPKLEDKILSREELVRLCRQEQKRGKKLVFTNGCFDILHAGHVRYLDEAAALGNILVLGLNSDASVKRLKGDSRPINAEQDRAIVLAGLQAVDYVCLFDEDTPYELIQAVQPNILVKGGDWRPEEIVGADIVQASGGMVRSLRFVEGISSTAIIKKMRES
ncbi:MAG: D-glycero-beta-D-manno-heptose 1-phosphate adenylyltransferase [Candidatus Cloacimonadales bacterium]|jgi:D-beta-D-heptose 7-phosphate kinase/D-beta-D-heptose 1-phosphate adenosyltransferase|nr:D-glycero-beta-D-manno-heptose 1-phosphate adenylyltransferase [Candidatus Cloacimonadota bacterium]MDY0381671.1 D-glycero-beta-D-manno-heptose 1-phosphate adenylyltransferase [Candidatus Cloacimonadaceae bacterium]MCB5256433.1 D-glycero-beta-D-manno-heptose 1-phosphate adenylyltransferase [Candidatus Cloacimonadota bacterium]MCB5263201.1 D-glycero-beta-D-manno-heptose 1-phosphate adenylyltransferase [Candidatus Cloacimonadota bacterium]MCB5277427.1 D-glycero-beta-D-manno-heptose 1-phosphate